MTRTRLHGRAGDPSGVPGRQDLTMTPRLARLAAPFRAFLQAETSGGIVLLAATVLALAWANSPWADSYRGLWSSELRIGLTDLALEKPVRLWINDGLMALFFLVVGLEIKREALNGELASVRRALLPVAAALGGAAVPALIYVGFNAGTDAVGAWGIPMATDIAFALGILALLGRRVPVALKVLVTAIAIVDDILAVLVIGVVYTESLALGWLALGTSTLVVLAIMNRVGVRHLAPYAALGLVLWVAVLQSGLHATLAGVLLAMTIPAGPGAHSPLHRLEHGLHPWTAYAVIPIFALANAGVALGSLGADALTSPIALGILAGLVIGKQIGILGATWLVVRLDLAHLPAGLTWRHLWGAAWVAGIGFTMSLFIGELAFDSAAELDTAKLGILVASAIAAIGGTIVLRTAPATQDRG
jgi:NhaA family Na+:H+ antiporter